MKKIVVVLMLSILSTLGFASGIGILGAMDIEVDGLKDRLENPKKVEIAGITYYQGRLAGQDVVIAKSGVGKVNSAVTATLMIEKFSVDSIIFTGVAGAIDKDLDIADVVVSTALVQHDYDTSFFDGKLGMVEGSDDGLFYADKELIGKAYKASIEVLGKAHVKKGIIATGDQFIADSQKVQDIGEIFGAKAVEMEGASVAQVATMFDIPFVVLRSMSDKADGSAHVNYNDFKVIAANNSIDIVLKILEDN